MYLESDLARLSAYETAYERIIVASAEAQAQLMSLGIPASRMQRLHTFESDGQDNSPEWLSILHWIGGSK